MRDVSIPIVVGQAFEELQTSLLSELRNSEGAKRLQQRFCGPEVVFPFNFMVVVSIIKMNTFVGSHIIQLVFILTNWFSS